MFEDVCFACSRPVDGGRAYCSMECASQETTSTDSAAHLRPLPSFAAAGRKGHRSPIAPTLQNTHPDYTLPLARIKLPLGRPKSPLREQQQQQHYLPRHHLRKRSSLSSSSTSSALSTPSAPPLTDDDDSMSEPDFTLDSITESANFHPTLSYARRPSATNTRSTIAPFLSSSTSASTSTSASASASASETGSRSQTSESEQDEQHNDAIPVRRSRHAHHLSVPTTALLNEIDKLFAVGKDDKEWHVDFVRPHPSRRPRDARCFSECEDDDENDKAILRRVGIEASHATLTKLSTATSKGSETIRQPKSRRVPTDARSRGSLPAYLSLMKISSSGHSGNGSPPLSSSPTDRQHKTSPTVAHSHTSSSIATLSATATTASTIVMEHSLRGDRRISGQQDLHQQQPLQQEPKLQPQEQANILESLPKELNVSTATPAQVGSNPIGIAITSGAPTPSVSKAPRHLVDAICEYGEECSGTPRGRTRSRSARPRSRSRSRTQERARRAHFGGASPSFGLAQDDLRGHNAIAAGVTRGRPHTRGMGMRGRRSRKIVAPNDADVEDYVSVNGAYQGAAPLVMAKERAASAEIDWLDIGEAAELEANTGRGRERTADIRSRVAYLRG